MIFRIDKKLYVSPPKLHTSDEWHFYDKFDCTQSRSKHDMHQFSNYGSLGFSDSIKISLIRGHYPTSSQTPIQVPILIEIGT